MKLAITMIPENERISPVFESSKYLLTVKVCKSGERSIIAQEELPKSEFEKVSFIKECGAKVLICGAICNENLESLKAGGMHVIAFVSGDWNEVLEAIINSKENIPTDFIMPGCCGHHKMCCKNHLKWVK